MNLPALDNLWSAADALGTQDFLVLPEQRYRYRDLMMTLRQLCHLFDDSGIVKGERIVICTENAFATSALFLAALCHGIVPVNLAPGTKQERARAIRSSTDAKMILGDPTILESWQPDCPAIAVRNAQKRGLFGLGKQDIWPLETAPPAGITPRLPRDDALAYLLFTSGSTSSPTGVEISLGNLLTNLESVGRITQVLRGDRVFNDLPMAHTDGLIHGPVLAFATGSAVIRAGGMQIAKLEDWLNTVRRERCTHFITVPFVWSLICRLGAHKDYFDAPEMKLLMSSAARLDPRLWDEIETRFGKPLANEYGMTETVMAAFHAGPFPGMGKKGTIGLPAHCEARIDPSDPGDPDTGELWLRGANIAQSYWKNPTRNATSFAHDGWLRTGDIVRRSANGNYDLIGRKKSIINSGGMNIHPDEINEVLERHALVTSAVTVPIADKEFGQAAVTVVEALDGATVPDLLAFARARLEPIKVPKKILIIDQIPRGASGKPRLADIEILVGESTTLPSPEALDQADKSLITPRVLQIAAQTFGCDVADLSPRSVQDDVPGWDSFSQLSLFLAVEEAFAAKLPSRKLTSVRSLGDLCALVGGTGK